MIMSAAQLLDDCGKQMKVYENADINYFIYASRLLRETAVLQLGISNAVNNAGYEL